jgi:hypothetical protein
MLSSQVTGGGDGGISLWPLHTDTAVPNFLTFNGKLFTQDCCSMKGQNENFPRRIGLTSEDNVVAITDSGCLLYCTVLGSGRGNWKLMHRDEKLASYCLLEMSPCRQYVALASMDGHILIFKGKYECYQLTVVLLALLHFHFDRQIT